VSVLEGLVEEVRPDLLLLFSVFSPLTIRLLWSRRRGRIRVPALLAPEGEFSPGALAQKRWKKRLFLGAALPLGLYRGLSWKATSELEVGDIRRVIGASAHVHLSPSFPPDGPAVAGTSPAPLAKAPGRAHLLYLSRITPKKNLAFVLERLNALQGVVTFDVIGPIDDARYWAACTQRIATLEAHVRVRYLGDVPHERVSEEVSRRHFLVLPTLGENFGFVIFEAFASGRPVLVSDRTPWRDLAGRGIGWDLTLDDPAAWRRALQRAVDMDDEEFQRMTRAAWQYAREYALDPGLDAALIAAIQKSLNRSNRSVDR
jgi:glycosyltransferase involved in cell wall biosynthesis